MPTAIRHVDLASVVPVALALGAVNGVLVSLPVLWHWIDTRAWITGVEVSAGMFALRFGVSILAAAMTTAIVAVVLAGAYNLVASRYGGIEVTFER